MRIYDRKYSKASQSDKEAFLEKNVIKGTKKDKKRLEKKAEVGRLMKRLSSSFLLDELLVKDKSLLKDIKK